MKRTSPRLVIYRHWISGRDTLVTATSWNEFVCLTILRKLFVIPDAKEYWLELSTKPTQASQPVKLCLDGYPSWRCANIEMRGSFYVTLKNMLIDNAASLGLTNKWQTYHLRVLYR